MKWIWGTCCSEQITVLYTVTLYIFTSLQADTVVWVVWFTYKSFQIWHRSSSWTLFACKRGRHLHMWVRTDIPMLMLLFLYHHNKVDPGSALQLTNDMSDHSVTITKNINLANSKLTLIICLLYCINELWKTLERWDFYINKDRNFSFGSFTVAAFGLFKSVRKRV